MKQILVVRKDLNMRKGKIAAQARKEREDMCHIVFEKNIMEE